MTPSWFYVLLAAVNISTTAATKDRGSSCCSKNPYAALRPLSKIPAIASYCSSKYPPPTTTTTTTAPTVTVTVVTGSTVLTTTVDTRTSTESTVTTLTEASTTTTTTTTTTTILTTITVISPLPNVKRSAPTPAAAQLKSFTRNGASFIKTACSCIQTPRKTTKTVTPTSTVRVISTRTSAVTAIVTVTTTRTDTITQTVTTTETSETVSQVTITGGPCPNGVQFARTVNGYGVCTSAAILVPRGKEVLTIISTAGGAGEACASACNEAQPRTSPGRCLGVQYQDLENPATCTLQTESPIVLTANPTLDAAFPI